MDVLVYNGLDVDQITGFKKLSDYLQHDDFKSADVKKIDDNLYRAKLNRSDRVLFSIYQYAGKKYALILEYLKSHDYEGSRFLRRGVVVDEDRIPVLTQVPAEPLPSLAYVNPKNQQVAWLNKAISFDACQDYIYQQHPPMILIGSAGSGKTALLLEKLKKIEGDVLYVTLSHFLVKHSHELYYSQGYHNDRQNVDFFSFDELLESIAVPSNRPISFQRFAQWYQRTVQQPRITESAHKLFEEFRGVLTGGVDAAYLSRENYLSLGVKQSIYSPDVRHEIYELFLKYLEFIATQQYYDSNMLSFDYLKIAQPRYDFVVVDEVQDLTRIQLLLILNMLRQQGHFLLCGDSNQIVHPNFFSWAQIKTLFYTQDDLNRQRDFLHILQTNYRNSPQVTELANRILLLKQARFGSIDRESNYLVQSNGHVQGNIRLLHDKAEIVHELDLKTKHSTHFAVVVMRDEQKTEAQQLFQTPLVFSIQEAKGLEYDNIILYNFISAEHQHYQSICEGVSPSDLNKELKYSRNKNKHDKSLEVYKFYINALYVALTRAVANLYWIESNSQHRILTLLGFGAAADQLDLAVQQSSTQDWQREAHKLELQGKQAQADRIRQEILKEQKPNWPVYTTAMLVDLVDQALIQHDKKAKLMLFEYAIVYDNRSYLHRLSCAGFKPAKEYMTKPETALKALKQKYYMIYGHQGKIHPVLLGQLNKFGLNFHNHFAQSPLLVAVWLGDATLAQKLIDLGADTEQVDNRGFHPLTIAVQQASLDQKYAKQSWPTLYEVLKPESLSVQIDGRLLKIQHHSMEYWMLQLMFVFMGRLIAVNDTLGYQHHQARSAIMAQQFEQAIAHWPTYIMPAHRKKRTYISSILSKNERNSSNAYNKKLFLRSQLGHYMLNPDLSIKVQGKWKKIYEWLPLDENIVFFEPDYVDRGEVIDIDQLRTAAWTPHIEHLWKVREARYQQEQLDARRAFLREMMGDAAPMIENPSIVVMQPTTQPVTIQSLPVEAEETKAREVSEAREAKKAKAREAKEAKAKKAREAKAKEAREAKAKEAKAKKAREAKAKKAKIAKAKEDRAREVKEAKAKEARAAKEREERAREIREAQTAKAKNELDQGVWTDSKTGLMWMRCSMGQTWDGMVAQGEAKGCSWDGAHQAIDGMNKRGGFAGYSDWRLPDLVELETIMLEDQAGYECPQGLLFKPCKNSYGVYWSGSHYANSTNKAWGVYFNHGYAYGYAKNLNFLVRAVRTGQ